MPKTRRCRIRIEFHIKSEIQPLTVLSLFKRSALLRSCLLLYTSCSCVLVLLPVRHSMHSVRKKLPSLALLSTWKKSRVAGFDCLHFEHARVIIIHVYTASLDAVTVNRRISVAVEFLALYPLSYSGVMVPEVGFEPTPLVLQTINHNVRPVEIKRRTSDELDCHRLRGAVGFAPTRSVPLSRSPFYDNPASSARLNWLPE